MHGSGPGTKCLISTCQPSQIKILVHELLESVDNKSYNNYAEKKFWSIPFNSLPTSKSTFSHTFSKKRMSEAAGEI